MNQLATLEPDFRAIMADIIKQTSEATGLTWVPVSCLRTIAGQNELYAKGRTTPGAIVTRAKGGESPHNFGLACDCAPLVAGSTAIDWKAPERVWAQYGDICENAGMTWGGNFKSIVDRPHCEHPRWSIEQEKWRNGEIHVY